MCENEQDQPRFAQAAGITVSPAGLAQSETHFLSTATPTGFEFVKDAQGRVTHLMVRGANGPLLLRARR